MTTNGLGRRVAYTKKKSRKKSIIVLGVDPGLANTGVVVFKKYPTGKLEILFSKTLRSKPGGPLRTRVDAIASGVINVAKEYKATIIICEAFEVRGWQKPRMSAQSMSKLINAISLRALEHNILFGLASPDMKKRTSWEELSSEVTIAGVSKVKSSHARDAGLHAFLYLRGDLVDKLGIN